MNWLAHYFELSRRGSVDNNAPMEGLRGLAVFLVFLVHYVSLVEPWTTVNSITWHVAHAMQTIGNSGVDLFFVLSGYLIYGSLMDRPQPFAGFMKRRLQRIYPAFLVILFLYLVLSFVFPSESKLPAHLGEAIVYVLQNLLLLPGIFSIEPIITVAWSLSYEMLYYLTVPLAILMLGLRQRRASWRVFFFVVLTVAIAAYCAFNGGHVRLVMFIAGILLYEALKSTALTTPSSFIAVALLLAGLSIMLLPMSGSEGSAVKVMALFIAFFVLCLACFRQPKAWLPQAFTWTPLRWLGNMSYSYYLVHGLALKAFFLLLSSVLHGADGGTALFWLLLPVCFAATLLPSAALFLLIERPFSIKPKPRRTQTARAAT